MNARLRVSPAVGAHKGLVLDKFLPIKKEGESNLAELEKVARMDSAHPAYRLAFERWVALTKRFEFACRLQGTVRGRLALGLGGESVTEIGCRLHHTYGVPFIPGSSLKGVLRNALAPPDSPENGEWKRRADFLFGTTQEKGFATVYDVWWIPQAGSSGLTLDVLTSHHSEYYTGKGDAPPGDFDDPVPNHFLTYSGNFLFVIETPNESWKSFIQKLLMNVLSEKGVGAKRSSGYGRFFKLTDAK
jgi:CRISPR-associated protein Cmr6